MIYQHVVTLREEGNYFEARNVYIDVSCECEGATPGLGFGQDAGSSHDRFRMAEVGYEFACTKCGTTLYLQQVIRSIPDKYLSPDAFPDGIADFEIVGVVRSDGSIYIEYPEK